MLEAYSKKYESGLFPWIAIPVLTVVLVLLMGIQGEASWFIDHGRFHVSVHGRISCFECHGDVRKESLHPDPMAVNKGLNDFYRLDQCSGCHREVVENLDSGVHAGERVKAPQEYRVCTACHDPHYQLTAKKLPPAFDQSKPVSLQCGVCHAEKTALPALSSDDEGCMVCHRLVEEEDPGAAKKVAAFCFKCHGDYQVAAGLAFPAVDLQAYGFSTHSGQSCLVCHPKSAEFGHGGQERIACLACHNRHDEKVSHAAHLDVSCEACHLSGIVPVRGPDKVLWQIELKPDQPGNLHNMTLKREEGSCERCHHKGNPVGAAAMVLPAKSIMCMPCHAATFSAGDMTTIISLFLFLAGMTSLCIVWVSARRPIPGEPAPGPEAHKAAGNRRGMDILSKTLYVLKIVALDIFLQRRLFKQSVLRWFIHSLIFWPFVFRFLWGMTALLTSLWTPGSSLPWTMLDKNDHLVAFLFDFSGLMILSGVILTTLRRVRARSEDIGGLPGQDWPVLILLGGIVIIGFTLEGMRIAMTGPWPGSGYAFLGYAISRLFTDNPALPEIYGYVWYLHAIVTGALVAYLPFSNLLHMIMAPVVIAMNAISRAGESG
ncbi:Nitrate reductase gamma subunit [Syntrophobacter sp. SbD1]|nr:Nitrate reductase gamma subunit [Syntrophobacter sp. SbD1]